LSCSGSGSYGTKSWFQFQVQFFKYTKKNPPVLVLVLKIGPGSGPVLGPKLAVQLQISPGRSPYTFPKIPDLVLKKPKNPVPVWILFLFQFFEKNETAGPVPNLIPRIRPNSSSISTKRIRTCDSNPPKRAPARH
jgi:hypothetical protein